MNSNILVSIVITLISGVIGAFIGTYFGAVFAAIRQEKRLIEVRRMALKAIGIFKSYAHGGKTFDEAADQFNNAMSIAEKRAVVVTLHKLGVPVIVLSNEPFCIAKVSFAHIVIDKEELDAIANQIKSGHCDSLFHIEPEKYFDENIRQKSLRSVAKRWVLEVLAKSTISEDRRIVSYPYEWFKKFSLGEKYAILVLKERISTEEYFCHDGHIDTQKITDLIRDIDCGLWDNCLYWDYTNYQNVVSATSLNATVEKMILETESKKTTEELLIDNFSIHKGITDLKPTTEEIE